MAKKRKSTLGSLNFRFTFESFVRLREYGVNPMRPATYSSFPPAVGAAFVWAGQLHVKHPLTYDAVIACMPTDTDEYFDIIDKMSVALAAALGVKPDAKPNASVTVKPA